MTGGPTNKGQGLTLSPQGKASILPNSHIVSSWSFFAEAASSTPSFEGLRLDPNCLEKQNITQKAHMSRASSASCSSSSTPGCQKSLPFFAFSRPVLCHTADSVRIVAAGHGSHHPPRGTMDFGNR